jgi:hypothetical protein
MKHFLFLFLTIFLCFPLKTIALPQQPDTIGMKVSRTFRTIQTTVFVEQSMDSIVSLDSIGANKITIVTYDTLKGTEATEKIDTSYFVTIPLNRWKLESRSEAAMTQVARWNWSRGGGDIYSILLTNKSAANYAHGTSTWKTEFDWRYGVQKQAKDPWFKTHDRVDLLSQYGFRASPTWYYSGLFQFNTQLSKSYASATSDKADYRSKFLSPARFTFSLGMEYVSVPKTVTLFLSPVAYKATYVMDTNLSGRFGIPAGEHWLETFGPIAMLTNKHKLTEDATLSSRLELFGNILEMGDPFITVDWKVNLDVRITRHMSLGLETWLIYDPTIWFDQEGSTEKVRKTQFQQSLMLRFVYRITN